VYEDIIQALSLPQCNSKQSDRGRVVESYQYGKYTKNRIEYSDGRKKAFYWDPPLRGADPGLYNVLALETSDLVYVVEGEKDVNNMKKLGLVAVSSPHGAGNGDKWRSAYNEPFKCKRVFILPDHDSIGYRFAELVRENIAPVAASVQILNLAAAYFEMPEHGDITDIYEAVGKEKTLEIIEIAKNLPPYVLAEGDVNDDNGATFFKEYIPFESYDGLPEFPLGALPSVARAFAHAAAESVQAPLDMVGACVLGALEVACRGRYSVQWCDHTERACLYIAPIAAPSERKSGVLELVMKPLVDYENEYNQIHGAEVYQNRCDRELLEGRIESAKKAAIAEKDVSKRETAEHQLQLLVEELASYMKIEPLRLYGTDVTPEKLSDMIKAQGEVFALVSAEGGEIWENIGKYTEKGGLGIYLSAYSGDRICYDRKGCGSIVVDHPTMSIIAPCQPYVVTDLFSDRQKVGRGLLSRILYIKCKSLVGKRDPIAKPVAECVWTEYYRLAREMLSNTSTGSLFFDESAFYIYCKFFTEIEEQLHPDTGELAFMAEWAGKLHGTMARLAGLFHCINAFSNGDDPLHSCINLNEAQAAVALSRFFLDHAKSVFYQQVTPSSVQCALYLWGKIQALQLPISKRELIRATHGKQDFDIDSALQMLIDRGYIQLKRSQTGGRPAETILINPEAETMVTKVNKAH